MDSQKGSGRGAKMGPFRSQAPLGDRLHDLQNYLHLVTMEVELAQMNKDEKVDCFKLLGILDAFKHSLQELRDQLLTPSQSEHQN